MKTTMLALTLWTSAVGCGAARPEPTEAERAERWAQGDAPPLDTLPDPPRALRSLVARAEAIEAMRFAAPKSDLLEDVSAWSREVFTPWWDAREAMTAQLVEELLVVERPPDIRHVAGAIAGHALETLAAAVMSAPVPKEVQLEPGMLEAYELTLWERARPVVDDALAAYRICADDASRDLWTTYCGARISLLQRAITAHDPLSFQ